MKWSWSLRLGKLFGIDVVIHWSFWILIVWIALAGLGSGSTLSQVVATLLFVLSIFGCVVLHELGHALTARRFGIKTRSITLLPIGGVARLESIPEQPRQEVLVALAGPAVNLVIAAITAVYLLVVSGLDGLRADPREHVVNAFLYVNVFLVGFNMLPAFPMDGGRVLRALLAHRMDRVDATRLAASIGQFMAVLFFFGGLFLGHLLLFVIALFVYFGAEAEARMVELRAAFRGLSVREIMYTEFDSLSPGDSLDTAVAKLLDSAQQDFPVLGADGRLAGMLTRSDLIRALTERGRESSVGDAMQTEPETIDESAMLIDALSKLQEGRLDSVPVTAGNGSIVGLLTTENMMELAMVRRATRDREVKTTPEAV